MRCSLLRTRCLQVEYKKRILKEHIRSRLATNAYTWWIRRLREIFTLFLNTPPSCIRCQVIVISQDHVHNTILSWALHSKETDRLDDLLQSVREVLGDQAVREDCNCTRSTTRLLRISSNWTDRTTTVSSYNWQFQKHKYFVYCTYTTPYMNV